jgi:hypothetical protein
VLRAWEVSESGGDKKNFGPWWKAWKSVAFSTNVPTSLVHGSPEPDRPLKKHERQIATAKGRLGL